VTASRSSADPLLQAAGVAIAPIAASGIAAALAPGRTVGSVIIALMIAVLAYLGGVVAALRFGQHAAPLAAHGLGRQLAAKMCTPVLLGGVIAAALSGYAALAVSSLSTLWAYRVGLVGARDLLGLTGRDRHRTALVCALLAGGPPVTRAVLYVL
jgi:hypothetical protein